MGDKVALPSLSLPKQRTHWTVGVVIAAAVLFIALGAAFYAVLRNRQAESDALTKRDADRVLLKRAEIEKVQAERAKADSERAASEARKKEAEAEGIAAQKRANANASANASDGDGKARKTGPGHKAGGTTKVANGKPGSPAAPAAGPSAGPAAGPALPPPPKEKSKASKDIDDLLRSFK